MFWISEGTVVTPGWISLVGICCVPGYLYLFSFWVAISISEAWGSGTGVQLFVQGVSKRALQLWKSIQIYTEDIHNVSNCHNVAKHSKFDECGTVVPNTASAPAVEIKMATFTGADRARVFWFEETKSATKVKSEFCWDRMFCAPCQVPRLPMCFWHYSGTA
jgi:hypothetical protein